MKLEAREREFMGIGIEIPRVERKESSVMRRQEKACTLISPSGL